MDEIIAPDMIGMRCPGWSGRAHAYGVPFMLLLDDLQSLLLPKLADGLAVDTPPFGLQEMVNLAVPKARILLRKPMDTLNQLTLCRLA